MIIALLQVRDVLPGDIYVKEHIASSYLFRDSYNFARLDDYSAKVENSNTPKIVRVYHSCNWNENESIMNVSFPALYCS